jgi:hypothetical protein
MKVGRIIVFLISILLLSVLIYSWYIGLFTSVTALEKQEGPYTLAGLEYVGPYKNAGKFMTDVEIKLKAAGIVCKKGFGVYYDNPKTTPEEKSRSFVGGVLEEKDFDKISILKSLGFKVDSVSNAPSVVVEFPIKSNLSFMIGPMKAYPVMSKLILDKGYKTSLSLEIYDRPGEKILYIMQYNNL